MALRWALLLARAQNNSLQQGVPSFLYREQELWVFQGCLGVLLSPPSQAYVLLI